MRSSLDAALTHILTHEGGWAHDPQDPGGCTMRGITLATYQAHGHPDATCAQLRRSTEAEARHIYEVGYWARVRGDEMPPGVDLMLCDHGVNAGPGRAVTLLRAVCGARSRVPLSQLVTVADRVYLRGPQAMVRTLAAARLRYYQAARGWPRYGRGWTRRVQAAEVAALDLVAADLRAAQERR